MHCTPWQPLLDEFHREVGGGVEVVIGRTLATVGEVEWELKDKHDRDSYVEMTGLLRNKTHGEELPVAWLYPKQWNGRAVVWLGNSGKSAIADGDGTASPAVIKLVSAGATVLGADLLFQGEFLKDGQTAAKARVVANPREFAGYTFGYNHALFAQRTHDVLTLVKFLRTAKVGAHPHPWSVDVAGFGSAGPIVAAARAVAGDAIDRAAVDTGGFRFARCSTTAIRNSSSAARSTWISGAAPRWCSSFSGLAGEAQRTGSHLRDLPCGRSNQ